MRWCRKVLLGSMPLLLLAGCNNSSGPSPEAAQPAAATLSEATSDEVARPNHQSNGAPDTRTPIQAEIAPPVVVLKTSLGEISVRLNYKLAPRTVQNFLNYVASGHYDGTIFHHIDSEYVALGGGYTPELIEKPVRYPIRNEADNGLKNSRGTIAMARQLDSVDSSTCQFFINLVDNPRLDHRGPEPENFGFCVFGEVVSGLEVLDRLAATQTRAVDGFDQLPVETVMLHSVRRIQ